MFVGGIVVTDTKGYIKKLNSVFKYNILVILTLGWNIVSTYDAILCSIKRMKHMEPHYKYNEISFNTKFVGCCLIPFFFMIVYMPLIMTLFFSNIVITNSMVITYMMFFYPSLLFAIITAIYWYNKKKKIAMVLISIAVSYDRDDIAYMLKQKQTETILFRAYNFLADEYNIRLSENKQSKHNNPFKEHVLIRI